MNWSINATMKLLTTSDVANRLGVSQRRVLALIKDGRLPAQRLGRDYLIEDGNLKLVAVRTPGRPPTQTGRAATRKAKRKR
jgi:excisionase family DNA binding protein